MIEWKPRLLFLLVAAALVASQLAWFVPVNLYW